MKGRKFTSVGLAVAAIIVCITGVTLFGLKSFVPSTYYSYSKHVHEWISIVFLIFIIIHTAYNIKPLMKYLAGKGFILSKELIVNFAVLTVLTVAVIISVSSDIKERSQSTYPEIESISLNLLLESTKTDINIALQNLIEKGYKIPDEELTLEALSKANNTNPKVLYSIMVAKK